MILLVMLCQTLVYKEVTALFELRDGQLETPHPYRVGQADTRAEGSHKLEEGDMWSKTLNW